MPTMVERLLAANKFFSDLEKAPPEGTGQSFRVPDVLFAKRDEDGMPDYAHGTLQPGNVYLLDVRQFIPEVMDSFDYLDEQVVAYFVKKIAADERNPLVTFTKIDLGLKIVSDIHVVEAALKLGTGYIRGVYVPHPALVAEFVEEIFL